MNIKDFLKVPYKLCSSQTGVVSESESLNVRFSH